MLHKLRVTSLISVSVLAISLLLTFPRQEEQPDLPIVLEAQPLQIPQTELEVTTTPQCVQIRRNDTSETGVLHLLLSSSELKGLSYENMLLRMQNASDNVYGKSIEIVGKNDTTAFCELESNTTYYLYYFEEKSETGLRSYLDSQTIQTQVSPSLFDLLSDNDIIILSVATVATVVIAIGFTLKEKGKRAPSKRSKEHSHVHAHRQAAEKVKKDWKLDLPDTYEIRMKRKFGTSPILKQKSEQDMLRVNKHLEEDNREFEDRRICGLCCDRYREVIFLDCGHIYACAQCSRELGKCPIDNKPIKTVFRFRVCDKYGIQDSILTELAHNSVESLVNSSSNAFFKSIRSELNTCEQYIILKEQHDNFEYFYKCVVCNQNTKDTLFSDCCHLVCCHDCVKNLTKCPIDGVRITKSYPVYFA